MATSAVDICNMALAMIGGNAISSFDEGTTEANLCKTLYPDLRDAVLEEAYWSFSLSRVALTNYAEYQGGYHHFDIPNDVLAVHRLYDSDSFSTQINDWFVEGNRILTRRNSVFAHCTKKIEDVKRFSNMFTQALATRIASELAIPIAGSATMKNELFSSYVAKVTAAKTSDGVQGTRENLSRGRILNSRYSGGLL